MRQYDSYRDSGVEWIGKIPSHWEIGRLGYTAMGKGSVFIDGDWIESPVIIEEGIRYVTTGNVTPFVFKNEGNSHISEDTFHKLNCTEVFPGDILISRLNEPLGKACIVPDIGERLITSVDCVIYRPDSKKYNKNFMVYYLNNALYTEFLSTIGRGAIMKRVARSTLEKTPVILPTLQEQKAIASYLDAETAHIDSIIEAREKKIKLLEELRNAVISKAVTKGIDKNVETKDSGIEWIGQIPAHWEIGKVKFVCKINGRIGFRGYTKEDLVQEGEGAYTIGGKHITNCVLDLSDPEFISWDKYYESPEIMVKKGDILTAQRGSLGKTALVREEIGEATINPSLVLLNSIKINKVYLYYYLVSNSFLTYIEVLNTSTAVPMISQTQISNINIPLPEKKEQDEIAEYLDTATKRIDGSISDINREIELLKEYRSSLITEVVTGKRKII